MPLYFYNLAEITPAFGWNKARKQGQQEARLPALKHARNKRLKPRQGQELAEIAGRAEIIQGQAFISCQD